MAIKSSAKTKTSRRQTTIDLTDNAEELLERWLDRRGRKGLKKSVLSQLVGRFAASPDPVKSVLLGWMDEGLELAYAKYLRQLADDIEADAKTSVIAMGASRNEKKP